MDIKIKHLLILGGGAVTHEFYLPALRRLGLLSDTIVAEPNKASCLAIADRFADVTIDQRPYAEVLAALASKPADGISAVIIALPNSLHVDAAARSISAGRHVLCEKPLALTAAECERLAQLSADAHVLCKVSMSRRYLPTLMLARKIVDSGELGPVRLLEVVDRAGFGWRPRSFSFFAKDSGGILADMGVHYLDYLDTLVGPMTPISYQDDMRGGTESTCRYQLRAGAVDVDIQLSRVADDGAWIRIACEQGDVLIEKVNEKELTVAPKGQGRRRVRLEQPFDRAEWPANYSGSFCQMLVDFDRAIQGVPTRIADVSDATRATGLIEWAYRNRSSANSPAGAAATAKAPDRVLVTGATGFIGGHLVDRLSTQGHTVRASVRSPASCANVARFAVEMMPTDLLNPDAARKAVAGQRTVFHLAYGQEGQSAPRITIDGTKNIVGAAIEAGVESVVVLSTMYVFGFPKGDKPVDESFPYAPYGGEYGASKTEMERWCLEAAATSGRTRLTILNPTCVFGPRGGAYTSLPVDLARRGQFCWISGGTGSCNYTYVENVVDAMIAAAGSANAHGERFIINDGTTTWRAFLEPLLAPLGLDIPSYTPAEVASLPRFGGPFRVRDLLGAALSANEVRTVAKRSAAVRRLFVMKQKVIPSQPMGANEGEPSAGPTAYPPEWIASLYSPARASFSSAKAERVLGWRPEVGLEEAQRRTIAWLADCGKLPVSPAGKATS